mmetsp:Transcript_33840/g.53808  ORF Transcript_33840/g.53808 Transcript_33840/m.53808 type:complete len:125 (-) Transcript_33840:85-459(-)
MIDGEWPVMTDEDLEKLVKKNKDGTEIEFGVKLHGHVLKLTEEFLNEHPGGPDVVRATMSKDSSQEFDDIAHSDSAIDWASKLIVGVAEDASEEVRKSDKIIKPASSGGGGSICGCCKRRAKED